MSSKQPASGLEQVRKSPDYQRMKAANRDVFEPRTIYFATYADPRESTNWRKCLQLKAEIVYHAITGKLVKTETELEAAKKLLVAIAKECKPPIATEGQKTSAGVAGEDQKEPLPEDYALEVDGVFLVVGYFSELNKITENLDREKAEIVKDIIKVENQLSLKDIKNIVDHVEDAIKKNETAKGELGGRHYKLADDFEGMIRRFCGYYSPFHSAAPADPGKDVLQKENLLHCLHFSLVGSKIDEKGSGGAWQSPSAGQLKRSGVRFEPSPKAAIDVEFSEPTLRMPALVHDFKLETVVGNLLAWEYGLPKEDQRPVTLYFQFMNELVGDLGDVRMMEELGLIKGTWKNLQEVFDLVKRTDERPPYPCVYAALDKEVRKVREYHDKKTKTVEEDRDKKKMRAFFKRHKPAAVLLLSSVAAASVIAAFIYKRKSRKG
ncbi:uncharacterized protein [Elaeis guineensis]|uniref:Uncharacterized protein LOC105040920 n=1 Tax=Elaeis guineensis var. tenera TaxID=51953 RepID=A0A6I9QVV3_ELAGV|nr:uncharacterized protein LOC105040920 [Elaeis guineensis]